MFVVRLRSNLARRAAVLSLSRTKQGCIKATYEVLIRRDAVSTFNSRYKNVIAHLMADHAYSPQP